MSYDIVIIGAGLGGLQCGYILSRMGLSVCVLEKERQAGGCLQTFRRGSSLFDTGFHYVGGLNEGQPLHSVMKYYDLLGLPWHRLDDEGFDEIIVDGKSYLFRTGFGPFVEQMSAYFPRQRENLKTYAELLKKVGDSAIETLRRPQGELQQFYSSLFAESAYGYLASLFDDPLLVRVLAGASMKLEPHPGKLPLYVFAQTNGSYIQSAWRLKGGGSAITDALAEGIRRNGGCVLTGREVIGLREIGSVVVAAELSSGELVRGKQFISNLHPAATLELIPNSTAIRKSYRRRISGLENTFGAFTVNIRLKGETLPYLNRNLHIHTGDIWSAYRYRAGVGTSYLLASYSVPEGSSDHAEGLDLLTPMHWAEVERWRDSRVGRRGEDYKAFKAEKAEECVRLAEGFIPGLRDAVDNYYTSTPLTWRDYTGTPEGSAYGIRKDYDALGYTVISPRTQLSNLFLTGQNLSVHGIMGVSMTSLQTCMHVLGADVLNEDFRKRV